MENLPMNIMPCQYEKLLETLSGYEKTGIPFIAYDGKMFKPAGLGDDMGLYYILPKITHTFGISADQAIHVFLTGVIFFSLLFGIIGCLLLFKRWTLRSLGVVELILIAYLSFKVGGIYIILSSVPILIIPLFLYFSEKHKTHPLFIIFLLFAGFVIGVSHYLRNHSGTGVLIFVAIILFFYLKIQWKHKIILAMVISIAVLAPMFYFDHLLDRRDLYLMNKSYPFDRYSRRHVFWHSVYIGFGFLNNEYVTTYKDEVAIEKVRSISPKTTYLSHEYERILRNEVAILIKEHPLFAARTLFAKIGVVGLYFIVFANIGLIAAGLNKREWQLEIAFFCAFLFNSLFGLLVIPNTHYLLGFIAFTTLYGLVSINQFIEHRSWLRLGGLSFIRRG